MKTEIKLLLCFLLIFVIITVGCSWEIVSLDQAIEAMQNELIIAQEELGVALESYRAEVDKSEQLSTYFDSVISDLEIANTTIENLKTEEYQIIYLGEYKFTHYCTEASEHICGTGTGTTATGTQVTAGRTIAVDSTIIPYGTEVYIEGYGWRIAEDCGGSVKGNHIDIAVDTHDQALAMGTSHGGVWILAKRSY